MDAAQHKPGYNSVSIGEHKIDIRPAILEDLPNVVDLDDRTTGLRKPEYWDDLFVRYGNRKDQRFFLVAEEKGQLLGCIFGEVRSWEFNSVPCGWVGTVSVEPDLRMGGIGSILYDEICKCFRKAGVTKIRTMIPRDATDLMSFFRAQGMMAGPFIQLETDMDEGV
ncbi:GNAT family N-acetyltransferase [Thalassospira sp.]|uniref:GNAT family N-acetyltransferase n=1 Tax=Thalassospira sp. TaxID=1912094 RepID=UPI002732F467|nr:GNAT family N-acetyltransferase [Thalassospira sp.]MDP2697025.1 GNAT family N-acetyltransferase [Thalassospira sp.]